MDICCFNDLSLLFSHKQLAVSGTIFKGVLEPIRSCSAVLEYVGTRLYATSVTIFVIASLCTLV